MKILAITNLYPPDGYGGYERLAASLCDGLASLKHDVLVLTTTISTCDAEREPQANVVRTLHLAEEYAELIRDPSHAGYRALTSRLVSSHNFSIVVEQLSRFRPDAILLFNVLGLGGLQLIDALSDLRLPWVWCLEDVIPNTLLDLGNFGELANLTSLSTSSREGRFFGYFVSPSKRLFDDIRADGCELNGALHIVPNWVSVEFLRERSRKFFQEGGPLKAVYAGQLSVAKGVDLIISALKLIRDRGRSIQLQLVGCGEIEQFESLALELGVSDSISFAQFASQTDLAEIYAASDVLLFPGLIREPFGNVAIEAASCGCVPIIGRQTGAAEWLEDGDTCLKVDRNPESFAATIESIFGGETLLEKLGRNGELVVRERFKTSDAAVAYAKILESITKPFSTTSSDLAGAVRAAKKLERQAFDVCEKSLNELRRRNDWYENEVKELTEALAEAKRGIAAFQAGIEGRDRHITDLERKLEQFANLRSVNFAQAVKQILKGRSDE